MVVKRGNIANTLQNGMKTRLIEWNFQSSLASNCLGGNQKALTYCFKSERFVDRRSRPVFSITKQCIQRIGR